MEVPNNEYEISLTRTFPNYVQTKYNFRVILGGLVLANYNDKWNALFLEHEQHHVRASYRIVKDGVPGPEVTIPVSIQPSKGRRHVGISVIPTFGEEGVHVHSAPPKNPDPRDKTYIEYLGNFAGRELHGNPIAWKLPSSLRMTSFEMDHGLGYTAKLADGDDGIPDLYRFEKGNNAFRELGHFMGIVNVCRPGSEVKLVIAKEPVRLPPLNSNEAIDILIHNACTEPECADENDFPKYYWPDGVVVHSSPISLRPRKPHSQKEMFNFRVACNLMLASELEQPLPIFS